RSAVGGRADPVVRRESAEVDGVRIDPPAAPAEIRAFRGIRQQDPRAVVLGPRGPTPERVGRGAIPSRMRSRRTGRHGALLWVGGNVGWRAGHGGCRSNDTAARTALARPERGRGWVTYIGPSAGAVFFRCSERRIA